MLEKKNQKAENAWKYDLILTEIGRKTEVLFPWSTVRHIWEKNTKIFIRD